MLVVERIDRAVRQYPERDALHTPNGILSYREFGALVEEFAVRLEAATLPREFVGIRADRDAGSMIAMVAAMKAGRPFVFLDARDSVSSNSDKVRLLGVRMLAAAGPAGGRVELAEVPPQWRPVPSNSGQPSFAEDDLCYAIYTSGSTGRPKCVLVRASPLAAVIADHVERLDLGPGCATLQFARLTFDGCLTETLWTLSSGARLVMLDEEFLAPGAVLQHTLEQYRITHLKTTPFALTVTEPSAGMCLEHVINGGGACRPSVLRKWSAVASFHNAYGLTETTVCNLLTDALDPADYQKSVPLGELVGDCGYYLRAIDDPAASDDSPTTSAPDTGSPDAAVHLGELVITGNSVAVGYVTEQGLQPFTRAGEDSAYPTGDIVERRDGRLYYVERLDRQVKMRGYRLDPGEIENAICRLDAVREAVVLAEALDGGDSSDPDALVCYYQGELEPRALRQHLEGILDPYKIPSVFTPVAVFPYTRNGKIDRAALIADRRPACPPNQASSPDVQVLHLVRSLTGTSDVELEDNFFDVGGDSASAVVLVNNMRKLGWIDAGVRDVLRAQNLRVLVDQLQERIV